MVKYTCSSEVLMLVTTCTRYAMTKISVKDVGSHKER